MNRSSGLAVIGPGRAGGALAIAALWAGYRVQTVPGPTGVIPPELEDTRVDEARHLSACRLLILATPDDAIEEVAEGLAAYPPPAYAVAHLSGFASVDRLRALEGAGMETGCLHPLQTLPSPRNGARALAGSTAAVTARSEDTVRLLGAFAESLGMVTFELEDRLKPLYHAGAATIALGLATAMGVAADLFEAAEVPWPHARPLAASVLENCFRLGPGGSLTGPVVRADLGTVHGHLRAASGVSEDLARQYRMLGQIAACRLDAAEVADLLETWDHRRGVPAEGRGK